jgi:nucleotide-binding universal stress UspA family protein
VRDAGVLCRCVLIEHETVDRGLLQVADQQGVELIVLGAHGGSRFSHRLLGAVTYKVSHAAHRPVVIVPVDWTGPTVTVDDTRAPQVHETSV